MLDYILITKGGYTLRLWNDGFVEVIEERGKRFGVWYKREIDLEKERPLFERLSEFLSIAKDLRSLAYKYPLGFRKAFWEVWEEQVRIGGIEGHNTKALAKTLACILEPVAPHLAESLREVWEHPSHTP